MRGRCGLDGVGDDAQRGLRAESEHLQCGRVALLHGRAQCVLDDPAALRARVRHPRGRDRDQTRGMVLPDVVEIVRHRSPYVERRIVPQPFEQVDDRRRIVRRTRAGAAPTAAASACLRRPAGARVRSGHASTRAAARAARPGWASINGRMANSAVNTCVSACSAAGRRPRAARRTAARTRYAPGSRTTPSRRPARWFAGSVASSTSTAAAKSCGRCCRSTRPRCRPRSSSSSDSKPRSASRSNARRSKGRCTAAISSPSRRTTGGPK